MFAAEAAGIVADFLNVMEVRPSTATREVHRMAIRIHSMKKYWKVAALVALAAIPLVILAKITADEEGFVPESGDDSDIFERELSAD